MVLFIFLIPDEISIIDRLDNGFYLKNSIYEPFFKFYNGFYLKKNN